MNSAEPTNSPRSRRERPAKPALSRDGIVAAAVHVLRTEGLGKVTMRRLAHELDTGPASLYVYVRNTDELHAAVLDALLAEVDLGREVDGRIHTYVAVRAPEEWLGTIDFSDTGAARAAVLALFDGWDDRPRALIADATGPLVPRHIHALPIGVEWERVPGVTLLGDAAHLMSPFAGEGANLAMFDGAELARAIVEHPGDTEAALASYEKEMFPRAAETAADSAGNLTLMFGPDAQQRLFDMFAGFDEAATEEAAQS
ncbi:FAD-dependent monooxygenase [Streptomyces sp. NPDC016845]|uniref:FAD-dependent monooxygenase n=1 Tax=Streptomyces sp. NPDC016845 TaxID=3364972 RepID=UPI003791BE5B